jgi:hypothetical protein
MTKEFMKNSFLQTAPAVYIHLECTDTMHHLMDVENVAQTFCHLQIIPRKATKAANIKIRTSTSLSQFRVTRVARHTYLTLV